LITAVVPFSQTFVRDRLEGMWSATATGLLRAEAEGLVLEWKAAEFDFQTFRRQEDPIRSVLIPWSEAQSIHFQRRLFRRGHLVLRSTTLHPLEDFPAAQGSQVVLRIARSDSALAQDLATGVELARAEDQTTHLVGTPPAGMIPPA
jgi:hypothetical protein